LKEAVSRGQKACTSKGQDEPRVSVLKGVQISIAVTEKRPKSESVSMQKNTPRMAGQEDHHNTVDLL
jgi:hypothetical protein